jgi:uncharacterized protein (TIGR02594 family)
MSRSITRAALALGSIILVGAVDPALARPAKRNVQAAAQAQVSVSPLHDDRFAHLSGPVVQPEPTRGGRRAGRRQGAQAAATVSALDAQAMVGGGYSDLVAEARRWMGTNPTGRSSLWCARFMNFVLKRAGYRGTGSDMARSFASYGRRISGPRVGAIAVLARGKRGGHVGVVSGLDSNGNPILISGNHGRRVGEGVYSRGRVIAYVLPEG